MLKWLLQSLVFFPCDFLFSFFRGSKYLTDQSSLVSDAESVNLQSMSQEAFERTVTIAKGSSSLGKFPAFHTALLFSLREDSGRHLPQCCPLVHERTESFSTSFSCREKMLEVFFLFLFMHTYFFPEVGTGLFIYFIPAYIPYSLISGFSKTSLTFK